MAEASSGRERRRAFSAEFNLAAVRRMEQRRSSGVNLTQIGRELGVRPDQLRKWKRQLHQCAGAAPAEVSPAQGKLPSEQDELRWPQCENARLQQGVAFLNSAAAYLARESR